METAVILGLIEAGKASLQLYFQLMRMAGKTDEEIDDAYVAAKDEFESHENLPPVPE